MKRRLTLIAVVGLCAAVFLWQETRHAPRVTPAGQPPLVEIHQAELAAWQQQFNAAAAGTRVVVWLSPT